MADRYGAIREALPILMAEAQAKGGRNERAALIVELLEERDALREALQLMVEMVEMNGIGRDYAMDVARAALEQEAGRG